VKLLTALLAFAFLACHSDTFTIDPDVSVSVVDFIEYGDAYGKIGRVVIGVRNQRDVPVYTTSISLKIETDQHEYYTTVFDDRGVPPGMKIFIVVEVAYISPEESSIPDGVEITDTYYM
jgi:hypothetical protein